MIFFWYIYVADIIIDPNETLMAMAKENIEDVSTDKLLRRKKFFVWILRIYLIVILVFTVAIILAKLKMSLIARY